MQRVERERRFGAARGGGQADARECGRRRAEHESRLRGSGDSEVTAGGNGIATKSDPLLDGTSKIRVAEMSVDVRTGGIASAADRAESIALAAGGEVDSDDRTSGTHGTASLVLRVPPDQLTAVLRQLGRLGKEVSRQLSTTDVTEKVADVRSRVISAQQSIARLRTLYASATRVADVISIESELNTREADLESLQAQQRTLDRQTALATVTLSLQTATHAAPAPKKKHYSGFVGGLRRGWDGFVHAASAVANGIGTALPFLVLLLLVAGAARLVWRRRPRRADLDAQPQS